MRGFIYKVSSQDSEKYYIGSTTRSLDSRLSAHQSGLKLFDQGRNTYNSCYEVLRCGRPYISLLEEVWCQDVSELRRKEGEYQKKHKDEIVNIRISGRTDKEWRLDNPEVCRKHNRKWYANNQTEILKKLRENYVSKKGEKVEYRQKTRYYDNKETILRAAALRNITKRGKRPTALTIEKYNITEDEIQEALQKSQAE